MRRIEKEFNGIQILLRLYEAQRESAAQIIIYGCLDMENYSILMSVYGKDIPAFLKESMDSMLNQTVASDDFVIIEDGPLNKELYSVLDSYSEKYPVIHRYSNKTNRGLAYSLNKGLRECKNRLVARMDSDDISAPTRCEMQLRRFEEKTELVIVGLDMYEFEGGLENKVSFKKMPESFDEIRRYAKRRSPFNHPSVMYDREVILDKFNGYNVDNHRAEDFELFSSVVFSNLYCENIPGELFYYRTNLSQIGRRFNWTSFKSVVSTELKNFRKGHVSFSDFFYVFCAQSFGFLCPDFLLKKIMLKHFRTKSPGSECVHGE